jgi:hypothetical protein
MNHDLTVFVIGLMVGVVAMALVVLFKMNSGAGED